MPNLHYHIHYESARQLARTSSEHFDDDVEVARPFFKLGRCETLIRFEVRCQFCASASSADHAAHRIVENIVNWADVMLLPSFSGLMY